MGALTLARAHSHRLRLVGGLLMGAVLLQISIGITMVHLGMPILAATLHNAGAAFLVLCMVTLLRLLWPESGVGVVTLRDARHPH
jgi:cytochrome c oxidase assembly protein subunit 15